MMEGVELIMINHKVENNPCDFDGCGRPSYWFDGTYARCKPHGHHVLAKMQGIEYKKGEMRMDRIIASEFGLQTKADFDKTHSRCLGNGGLCKVFTYKESPDHPYCFDCTRERSPHLIDRRDWTAVRLAVCDHLKGLSQSDAFEKLHGCAI